MNMHSLSPWLRVTDQLVPKDIPVLKKAGILSVVCNRPDGEQPDQPDHFALQAACSEAGLSFTYLPVAPGGITDIHVQQFGVLLERLPAPIAAYCRTGTRSTSLWALSQIRSGGATPEQVISIAGGAGYDLSGLDSRLRDAPSSTAQ